MLKNQKHLLFVFAGILILFAVSCNPNVEHEHSFATQWTNDNSQHWHECECGEKSEIAAHEEDEGTVTTPATCTAKGVKTYKCKTCGYVMRTEEIPVDSNNHIFDKTTWKKDGTNHWHECACGEKSDVAAHEENEEPEITPATYSTKGIKAYKCKTCGYVMRTEEIPPLGFVKVTGTEVGSFYMEKTELTYARWYEVYQWAVKNGYTFQNLGREGNSGTDGAEPTENSNQPVTCVSWRDAIIWCNAASEMENLTPYYYVEGTTDFTDKTKVVRLAEDYNNRGTNKANKNTAKSGEGTADKAVCNTASNGYRLPTEKEWEYAAKGGEDFTYSGSDTIGNVAWYNENSEGQTHDVGTKKPNKYGLKDMSGNVWEWCWDRYSSGSSERVRHGGSWYGSADYCAVSYRGKYDPFVQYDNLGFRVCCSSAN